VSGREAGRNPFGLTASLNFYVPRRATELALAALVRAVRSGQRPAALAGPRGIGKTLLLHLLADRMGHELRFVYLPYGTLPPAELCAWALGRLLLPQSGDPCGALADHAAQLQRQGSALLLLVDDVAGMSLETARWLGGSVARSNRGLRLVVASADGPTTGPVLAALHPEVEVVRLETPMSEQETCEYLLARLERAGAPAVLRARFDGETLATLQRLSEGLPDQLHALASAVIRGVSTELVERFLQEDGPGAPESLRAAPLPPTPAPLPPARAPLRTPTGPRVFATALGAGLALAALVALRPALPPPPPRPAAPVASPADPPEPRGEARMGKAPTPGARRGAEPLQVQVNAIPWARVEVDGVDIGMTPRAGIPLLPGPHRFRARMPDGRVLERTIEIGPRRRHVVFE